MIPMLTMLTRFGRRGVLNPIGRAAVITWAWTYRHEIMRWGRTLWDELVGRGDVDPTRALRTAKVLVAIAGEDVLRNASELRRVRVVGDTVELEVKPGWRNLPRLVEKVRSVSGVAAVTVNGHAVDGSAAHSVIDARATSVGS